MDHAGFPPTDRTADRHQTLDSKVRIDLAEASNDMGKNPPGFHNPHYILGTNPHGRPAAHHIDVATNQSAEYDRHQPSLDVFRFRVFPDQVPVSLLSGFDLDALNFETFLLANQPDL
jgi:hypothetical protein